MERSAILSPVREKAIQPKDGDFYSIQARPILDVLKYFERTHRTQSIGPPGSAGRRNEPDSPDEEPRLGSLSQSDFDGFLLSEGCLDGCLWMGIAQLHAR